MTPQSIRWSRALGLSLALAVPLLASGHANHVNQAAQSTSAAPAPDSLLKLPDTVLTDQDGRALRLLGDVVGDKVVVVSFVYTHCTTVCPVVSQLLAQVQAQLGAQQESEVRLVSLSIDPARDTPTRLKAYAARHEARPGWLWLTGPSANVNAALRGFGTYTPNYQDHPAVVMVGDGRSGRWTRFYGFPDPRALTARARDYLAARQTHGHRAGQE